MSNRFSLVKVRFIIRKPLLFPGIITNKKLQDFVCLNTEDDDFIQLARYKEAYNFFNFSLFLHKRSYLIQSGKMTKIHSSSLYTPLKASTGQPHIFQEFLDEHSTFKVPVTRNCYWLRPMEPNVSQRKHLNLLGYIF